MKALRENLLLRFSLASLVLIGALAVGLAVVIGRVTASEVLQEAKQSALQDVNARTLRYLNPGDFQQPMRGGDYDDFMRFMEENIVSARTARVKIWNREGQVIFSTDRGQVGETYPIKPALAQALRGEAVGEIDVPDDAENEQERRLGTLIEIYTPAQFPASGQIVGAIEVYQHYAPYAETIATIQRNAYVTIGSGAALLYGVLFLIVRQGWGTIQTQQRTVHRRTERLRTLHQIDRAVLESRSVKEVASGALRRLREAIPCQRTSVVLFDFDREIGRVITRDVNGDVGPVEGTLVPLESFSPSVTSPAHRRVRRIRYIEDLGDLEEPSSTQERLISEGMCSTITAPLIAGDELIGELNVSASRPAAFDSEHREIAREVADQLAIAIRQARLFQETQGALNRERRLTEVPRAISGTLDLPTVLSQVVRLATGLGEADAGALALVDPDGEAISYPYLFNLPEKLRLQDAPRGKGLAWHIVDTGESVLIPEYGTHSEALPQWVEAGVHAFIGVPIAAGEERIGALGLFSLDPKVHLAERDLALAEAVGRQAGVAIQNARRYEAEQDRRQELDALYSLSHQLVGIVDLDGAQEAVVRHAVERVHVTFCRVLTLEKSAFICQAAHPVRALGHGLGVGQREPEPAQAHYQRVLHQGKPVILGRDDPALSAEERRALRLDVAKQLCLAPLQVGDEDIGLLALGEARSREREPFDADKLHLVASMAEQASSALHRARLHEELEASYLETVLALARAMDAKDTYTADHSGRLAEWAVTTAQLLGCGEEEIKAIRWGALLHDVGKIGVPDSILLKPGELDEEEWDVIQQHPEVGAEIVAPVKKLEDVVPIIRAHQEKYDGTGYPDKLEGEEIPLGARILAVVDAYSAITDKRPYKEAQSHEEAVAELKRCAGTQFDPQAVEAFVHVVEGMDD